MTEARLVTVAMQLIEKMVDGDFGQLPSQLFRAANHVLAIASEPPVPAAAPSSRLPQEPTAAEGLPTDEQLLAAIQMWVEPTFTKYADEYGPAEWDNSKPAGIHVDEAEDIPMFFDRIRAALARHESAGSE